MDEQDQKVNEEDSEGSASAEDASKGEGDPQGLSQEGDALVEVRNRL